MAGNSEFTSSRPGGDQLPACSVGIMAYNEEANIAKAIGAILAQRLSFGVLAELVVVASGCTDRTTEIVKELARSDPRVRLIVQERRAGKASAINVFVGAAQSPVLLIAGADLIVRDGTIDAMLSHFRDPSIGMVGAHPIPVNDESTFLGHAVHLLWRLHDRLARLSPKLGEVVAFRNVVPSIPVDTAVDEISLQALVTQLGYRLVYEPEAVIYNRGPATVKDFLRQRRRIYAGHLRVRNQQGYEASTMSLRRIAQAFAGSGSFAGPRAATWTLGTIALEAAARVLGEYDHLRRRSHQVWDTAITTKNPVAPAANPANDTSVLVFNIANFHRLELEQGLRVSRMLAQRVTQQIQLALGRQASVTTERSGTIVVLLPSDRDEADRAADLAVRAVGSQRLRVPGARDALSVNLSYGIIAFSPGGQAITESMPATVATEIQPVLAG